MVNKCCVVGCRGNYDNKESVSVFSFPKDERLKNKWLRAIRRDNFVPTAYSKVCEQHFKPEELVRVREIRDESGFMLCRYDLKQVMLKSDAVPSVFKNIARLETKKPDRHCFSTLKEFNIIMNNFQFPNWNYIKKDHFSLFLLVEMYLDSPIVHSVVTLNSKLEINVFKSKIKLNRIDNYQFPLRVNNINFLLEILRAAYTFFKSNERNKSHLKDIPAVMDN